MRRLLTALCFAFYLTLSFFISPSWATASGFECNCGQILGRSVPGDETVHCTIDEGECRRYCAELEAANGTVSVQEPELGACVSTPDATPIGGAPAPDRTVVLQDPLNLSGGIPQLIANIIKAAVGVMGALALLIFVYGGFLWLTSGGESAKIQEGKEAMKWTAIGLIVVFSSYALVSFVLDSLTNSVK